MPKSKHKQIQKLIKAFQAFDEEVAVTQFIKSNFYPFSNESGLGKMLGKLRAIVPFSKSKPLRVALLTGESSICSMLPELSKHCDVVLFVDINTYTMSHIRFLIGGLLARSSRKGFRQYYEPQHEVLKNLDFEASEVTPDIDMRQEELGDDFFLASKKRYKACREAVKQLEFGFAKFDLFNASTFSRFTAILTKHDAQITVFNATNLFEWDAETPLAKLDSTTKWRPNGKVGQLIKKLTPEPLILHSVRKDMTASCDLRAKLSLTAEHYERRNQKGICRKLHSLHGDEALQKYPSLFKSSKKRSTAHRPK